MMDFIYDHFGSFLVVFLIVVLILGVVGFVYEERAWKQYAAQHHCEAKGTRVGQTAVGPSASTSGDGSVALAIVQEPDQTIYVCDGGEIVIR